MLEESFGYRAEQDGKSLEERTKALPLPWRLSKIKEEGGKGDGEKKTLTRKEKSPSPTAERRKTRSKNKSLITHYPKDAVLYI